MRRRRCPDGDGGATDVEFEPVEDGRLPFPDDHFDVVFAINVFHHITDTEDLELAWRGGLDRSPIDLSDEASARWLLSCVWPEQRERVSRLERAIELARDQPWTVVRGDAVADLDERVLGAGGRHYLAKDSVASPAVIAAGYPRLAEWQAIRHRVDPSGLWASDQARRLGLLDKATP